jgi:hypothetical protein
VTDQESFPHFASEVREWPPEILAAFEELWQLCLKRAVTDGPFGPDHHGVPQAALSMIVQVAQRRAHEWVVDAGGDGELASRNAVCGVGTAFACFLIDHQQPWQAGVLAELLFASITQAMAMKRESLAPPPPASEVN